MEVRPQAASVPICNTTHYADYSSTGARGEGRVQLSTIGAIYNGLLQTSETNKVSPFCPSGNCTFPMYQSLAFCNECGDISDKMKIYQIDEGAPNSRKAVTFAECQSFDHSCEAVLPGHGIYLGPSDIMNSTIDYSAVDTDSRPSPTIEPPVGLFRGILRRGQAGSYSAVECKLRFCVKTYRGVVRLGSFDEEVISSTWANSEASGHGPPYNLPYVLKLPADPCYVDGEKKSPPYTKRDEAECTYNVYRSSIASVNHTLNRMLSGFATYDPDAGRTWSDDTMQALYGMFTTDDYLSNRSASFDSVNRAMTSLARALTNHSRSLPSICAGAAVRGKQFADELYLHVRWRWLAPTAAVLGLGLAFLAAVVVQSWDETLWKSSVFAYLVSRPRVVGGAQLSAAELLARAETGTSAGAGAGTGRGAPPVPEAVEQAWGQVDVRFDAAAIRFRTRHGEAE